MVSKFCPSCGSPRQLGVRFCGGCGAAFDGATRDGVVRDGAAPTAAPFPTAVAPPPAPVGGWQVAVGDQQPMFAPIAPNAGAAHGSASGAAPAATSAKPQGASIRGQVLQMLMVTGTDWFAARATGDPAATKLADVRAGLAIVATIAGLISGRSRGFFSKITMLSSLGLAFAQSPSLFDFGQRILANPSVLGPLMPNIATQGLSFLAAIRSALAARK
ncbi:MAG: zinc ribbon domain-containing protein [Gemmatimonadota bacterium]|nr:zinc ribbon domain-containing protein [Gemmatimonadota bacterium]